MLDRFIYNWNNIRTLALLYTDPGSGALLWQLLLAAFFGALFYARLLMRRIIAMIFRKGRGKQNDEPAVIDRAAPTNPNRNELP
jgi:hypothetical protein